MLPVYFLVTAKVSKKTILAILSVGVATMLFYDRLFDVVSFLKSGENMLSIKSAMRNGSADSLSGNHWLNICRAMLSEGGNNRARAERKRIDSGSFNWITYIAIMVSIT